MKKIGVFLLALIGTVVIVGCNNRKTVTHFAPEEETAKGQNTDPKGTETIVKVPSQPEKPAPAPIELKNNEPQAKPEIKAPEVAFKVISLRENQSDRKKGSRIIQGTTPASTAKIVVNGQPLSQYKAGQTQWSFVAAVGLGNLKKGENQFGVQAQDSTGKVLGSETFMLAYDGIDTGKLVASGMESEMLAAGLALMGSMGLWAVRKRKAA